MPALPRQSTTFHPFPAATAGLAQILIVDDDQQLRELMALLLEHNGYTVAKVANGRAALDYLACHPVAVLITDIFMPGFDGLELISAIRQAIPRPRLIAMSGSGDTALASSLYTSGKLEVDGKLCKPFGIGQLMQCIQEILSKPEPGSVPA